jgi:hypothetical protein
MHRDSNILSPFLMNKQGFESLEEGVLMVIVDNHTARDNAGRCGGNVRPEID